MQVVVDLFVLWQDWIVCAITEAKHHLKIRDIHASSELTATISSLYKRQSGHFFKKNPITLAIIVFACS